MIQRKSIQAELKQATDEGSFEAVIATLGKVDSDGDIVESGAFGDAVAPIVPAHNQGSVPLGKARIEERGDQAVAVGQFNLDVGPARDWHAAIKFDLAHPPAVQEWSWGYYTQKTRQETVDGEDVRVLEKVDLFEFSPVLRGASVGTRTISAKSKRHKTETSEAPWDASLHVRRLEKPMKSADVAAMFAYVDGDRFGFPHHFVTEDGPGAASTKACLAGIAVLNGARGGTTLSREAAKAVYDHLAGHLEDAGVEAPDLRAAEDSGLKLIEQVNLAIWDVEAAVARIRETSDARRKRGRELSDEAKAAGIAMATVFEDFHQAAQQLDALVKHCAPQDEVSLALAAWEAHKARGILIGS